MDPETIESWIPDDIPDKLQRSLNDGDELMLRLLKLNRTNQILNAIYFCKGLVQSIDINTFSKYAGHQIGDPMDIYEPMQIQAMNYLINSLYDDPTAFAIIIGNLKSAPYFNYVAYILVPAVFNYFSTSASLEQAAIFYIALGNQLDFNTYTTFVTPFFCSTLATPFAENSIKRQLLHLQETNVPTEVVIIRFIQAISKNLHFLPQTMLFVLDFVTQHWGNENGFKFVLKAILYPHLTVFLKTGNLMHSTRKPSNSSDILFEILTCKYSWRQYLDLTPRSSKLEPLPRISLPNHPERVSFIFTPYDIHLLTGLPMQYNAMVRPLLTNDLPNNHQQPFLVQVTLGIKYEQASGVIFDNPVSEKACYFESFLKMRNDISRINDFIDMATRCEHRLSFCAIYVQRQLVERQYFDQVWAEAFKVSHLGSMRFWRTISAIDQIELYLIEPVKRRLYMIETQLTSDMLILKMDFRDSKYLAVDKYREAITDLASSLELVNTKSKFSDRFVILVAFMTDLFNFCSNVNDDNEINILKLCFIIYDPIWIIRTCVIILGFMLRDNSFCNCCPRDIYDMLMKFTPMLIQALAHNPNTADQFTEMATMALYKPMKN